MHSRFPDGFQEPDPDVELVECSRNRNLFSMLLFASKKAKYGKESFKAVANEVRIRSQQIHLGNFLHLRTVRSMRMKSKLIQYLKTIYRTPAGFDEVTGEVDGDRVAPILRDDRQPCYPTMPHPYPGLCPLCVVANGERIDSNEAAVNEQNGQEAEWEPVEVIDLTHL